MRRPSADINTAGHDSFLDIVSNIVGILVVLVLVVGVRIKNAPARADRGGLVHRQTAQLERDQGTVFSLRRDVSELERQTREVKQEALSRFRARNRLATMVAAARHNINTAREQLDERAREGFDQRRELADAQKQVQRLKDELSHARAVESQPTIVESLPTPLSSTVDGTELHFQLREGRVAFIPLERLIEELKSEAQYKIYKLREVPEVTDTVGPEGGFRLRYTLARRTNSLEEHLAAGRIEIQLQRWTLIPVSNDLGETVDAALRKGSRFQSVLAGYRPDTTTVTIWVYPDSFTVFRQLKKKLFHMGFATAGRPLPDGFPISGSPEGSKSAAQ
jgi:hypothetical protein